MFKVNNKKLKTQNLSWNNLIKFFNNVVQFTEYTVRCTVYTVQRILKLYIANCTATHLDVCLLPDCTGVYNFNNSMQMLSINRSNAGALIGISDMSRGCWNIGLHRCCTSVQIYSDRHYIRTCSVHV